MSDERTTRRDFLKAAGGGALAAGLPAAGVTETLHAAAKGGEMQYRTLGKTGERVSVITLGGYHIGVQKDEAESIRLMHAAIDGGINFFDNAWKYNGGESERRMGKALKGGKRDKVFLMTKSNKRTKAGAMQDLEDSLRRLQTDRLDLWQVHEVAHGDPKRVFGPDGSLEAFVQARKQGKVRYIGFTGHTDPKVHQEMLGHDFEWATVQMPESLLDHHYNSFEKQVLPELVKRSIGVIAMKTLVFGKLPRSGKFTNEDCWQYVLTLPVTTVCTGMRSMEELQRGLAVGRSFKPMEASQKAALLAKAKPLAAQGKLEHYKQVAHADGCPIDHEDGRFC